MAVKVDTKANYQAQAQKEYDVGYNQKVTALKNQLAQQQLTLDGQKGGINSNFDTQVQNQNLSNKKAMNNISNTALGRGLQNSSIVTSGLAESDQINNRLVGNINSERTGALNDVESQKTQLATGLQATLGTMSGDRQSAIDTLARQLEDSAFDKGYKNTQLEQAREQYLADIQYKKDTLAQNKALADAELAYKREVQKAEQTYRGQQLAFEKEKLAQQLAVQREQISASRASASSGSSGYSSSSGSDTTKYVMSELNTLTQAMAGSGQDIQKYNYAKSVVDNYSGVAGMEALVNSAQKFANKYYVASKPTQYGGYSTVRR